MTSFEETQVYFVDERGLVIPTTSDVNGAPVRTGTPDSTKGVRPVIIVSRTIMQ